MLKTLGKEVVYLERVEFDGINRTEGKILYFQNLSITALSFLRAEALYWIALILLAGVLVAEVWGIYIVIQKLVPILKKSKGDKRHYAVAAPLMLTALPMPLQIALLVEAICAAAAALARVALLVILHVVGYRATFSEEEEEAYVE